MIFEKDVRFEMLRYLIGEIEHESVKIIQHKKAVDLAKVKCRRWNEEHKGEKPKYHREFLKESGYCETKKSRIQDNAKLARRLLLELSKEV